MTIKGKAGEQLAMFMTPREIIEGGKVGLNDIDSYDASDYDDGRTEEDMLIADKSMTAKRTGFTETIAREGIQEPLSIRHTDPYGHQTKPVLDNGHHRVVATIGTPRYDQLAPVVHHETWRESKAWGERRKAQGARPDVNWKDEDG